MEHSLYIAALLGLAISISHGCEMGPAGTVWLPRPYTILDTYRGNIFTDVTRNIEGIANIGVSPILNKGPYFGATLENSTFSFYTIDSNFNDYEEHETADSLSFTVLFNCVGGTTRSMTILVKITDTNNNDPRFTPNEFEFTIIPPLPPGFSITGCFGDITVRDIDLTTQRIDFAVFNTSLFAIEYDAESSTVPKEFKASLRTTTFIRSIPEPIEFTISATDVDLTGDPPRTTYGTVRIKSDGEFELPEEPVFTQTFYLATYTAANEVNLQGTIALRQGYSENVKFSLDQGGIQNFGIQRNGNEITVVVVTPLSSEMLTQRQILLVINAESENTSGASATVIVKLPEGEELKFEQPIYKGAIVDNILQLPQLVLSQGYNGETVSVNIISEHAAFFVATIQQNRVTLSMSTLPENIIEGNAFLNLQVVASTTRSSTSTIVTLEIVKDDTVTPVFGRAVYEGAYDPSDGLTLEQISLVQGYDETVRVSLQGDYREYFGVAQDGPSINLTVSNLPSELFSEQSLILYLRATKPRTVGATTAISIALPPETQLEFEQQYYRGVIEDNILRVSQLRLSKGYESNPVSVRIISNYASFFRATIERNVITLAMSPLDAETIKQNTFLNLEIVAETNRSSASAIVTLEVIKDDVITPVFERAVYAGTYNPVDGLKLEEIVLTQGYDESVNVALQGEHATFFRLSQQGPRINVLSSSLPASLLSEHSLLLSIVATKPRTVGANSAITITLPEARSLRFSAEVYAGTIREKLLQIENIVLSVGYAEDVAFSLTGEFASYFNVSNVQNRISLDLVTPIPDSAIEENNFLLLTLSAAALNAVTASTTIALDIVKEDLTTPVFSQNIYHGTYASPSSLNIGNVTLSQGFDETVRFRLNGEHSQYFQISVSGNAVLVGLQSAIPAEVIFNEKMLLFSILAEKELTVGANAAISISFPRELTEPSVLRFAKNIYIGSLQQTGFSLENIVLESGFATGTQFDLSGDFSSHFSLTSSNNVLTISPASSLPAEIFDRKFISLQLEARRTRAISVSTAIIIDIAQPEIVAPPVFAEAYYSGVYTQESGLQFENEISLSQGFDETVTFVLEGDSSRWFNIIRNNNTLSIGVISNIPSEVIAENLSLLFSIVARKPGATDGRAAISIGLPREAKPPVVIRFSQASYVGQIKEGSLELPPVALIEGYSEAVNLVMKGEFASYFAITRNASNININLITNLPTQVVAENAFILLSVEASYPDAISGHTTVVIELVKEPDTQITPVFEKAYYTGQYSAERGLDFEESIRLIQGFDESVVFSLAGDNSQWFSLVRLSNNSFSLELSSPIPPEVLANNKKLIFVVSAQRPGGSASRATIVISLANDSQVLKFDRISYIGSIANNTANLSPIVLSEGFTSAVTFSLYGELASYFRLTTQGATVTVTLADSLPVESIPTNRIILLEIRASATQAVSAFATIVFEVILDDSTPPAVDIPLFGETYYIGSYTTSTGLTFSSLITLTQGYGPDVMFALEGDNSQWFSLTRRSESSVSLDLSNPIPPAVVANNQKLIFVVSARRPGGPAARATIVISLNDEINSDQILGFDRTSYVGSIANNTANLSPVVLSEGYTSAVTFTLHGQLTSYFRLTTQGATVTITLAGSIPVESIPTNRIILLEIRASAPQAVSAFATIVFEVILDDTAPPVVDVPLFGETYYVGSYTTNAGLTFSSLITLTQGSGPDVMFALEGDNSQWFSLTRRSDSSVSLELSSPIPPAVVANNQKLIFVVSARRPSGLTARATIVISLNDDIISDQILGFDRTSYVGSIANNTVNLSLIVLSEGFTNAVTFTLHGQLASYFRLTTQGATVTITLEGSIPVESIPTNRIILLEIRASAPQAVSAFATIVFEVILDDTKPPVVDVPLFGETYYVGSYTANAGLTFSTLITLTQGYGPDVMFALEGENSQWFSLNRRSDSSVSLELSSPIPPAVVANNQKLIFVVSARRPGALLDARATIVISLSEEINTDQLLGFDRNSYVGSIANNTANLSPIVLSEGYTSAVTFTLHGQLASYFRLTTQGATVTITLAGSIPVESIPTNRIILLEIRASAPQAVPAFATIVFEVILDDTAPPVVDVPLFGETYYVGSYTTNAGLTFSSLITLTQGSGPDVMFALEGDNSQWFSLARRSDSSVSLELSSPIPPAVVANNRKLIFVVSARKPEGSTARATIVISLNDEMNSDQILGFDRTSYVGSIANNTVNLSPIVLSEGFTNAVTFTLHGQLASYFRLTTQGATVTITLEDSIPVESIPTNRIILLEIRASAPQAVSAFATIVFEVILDDTKPPVVDMPLFGETYYLGSYTANAGLTFSSLITLTQGYGPDVMFALEGENSQWFSLNRRSDSSVSLELSSPIPPAVVANNQKLIFVVSARRPGALEARATIVISLSEEINTDQLLGFDRNSYVGSIANNTANLSPIVLSEGYTSAVTFTLHGQLASYFRLTTQGATVTITLTGPIPVELIPTNRIILLEIQASASQAVPAFATIVFEVILDDSMPPAVDIPLFGETYYVGSYTTDTGLTFSTLITLTQGYGPDVMFTLEGENTQWFSLTRRSESSVSLELSSPIPPAVVANNQKLIFVVSARRPSGLAARATIVISMNDEINSNQIIGFDRTSYVGSIANNTVNLSPIVLSEGFTNAVTFTLHGQLASYFRLTTEGATVTITLAGSISVESIPTNRIILLEIRASAPQAVSAFATIVFEVILDDTAPPVVDVPLFGETYYVGSYTTNAGLTFSSLITLTQGSGPDVMFALEGDNSQWFSLARRSDSSVSLELSSPIPPAVVANNRKLIFVVSARKPEGSTARATIVISLNDEMNSDQILGFDRTSYVGSIANNTVNLSPIVLSEGFTNAVTFTLHGQLASYFRLTTQGATVTITLEDSIPVESIPTNRIILLEIRASAPQAVSAFATIVFEVILDDTKPPVVDMPLFDDTYYVGSYTTNTGLTFSSLITLTQGYGPDVIFNLEGDNSQWFSLIRRSDRSVSLEISSPIPPAVVANNQKLIFVVSAQRPGGTAARATIVISLTDEIKTDQILGFDRISYVGSIANNTANLSPIVLSEGFTSAVTFSLHGQLSSYFRLTQLGATVTITLEDSIPVEIIPTNRIILLEIRASAPQAVSAFATIVFEVILDDTKPPVVDVPLFDETYYVGSYTTNTGLTFSSLITLTQGYGPDVIFTLEGDNSQWFSLIRRSDSSVSLEISSPIPPAVVANNQKLIFVVSAQSGGTAARATIVISLTDEIKTDQILGFERISYVGSIAKNTANLSPIILSEGFTSAVTFTLHGQLANYFLLTTQGATVTIILKDSLPPESIPSNRIILLEIQASAPQAISAFATIVFEVILDNITPPAVNDLEFDRTYYTGSYSANTGLVLDTPITLAKGYNQYVVFSIEGSHAEYFTLRPIENVVLLELNRPIPSEVIANNLKLIFVISAQRLESRTAKSTVVIKLERDFRDNTVAFNKILYEGIIEGSTVQHEAITVKGYNGTVINISGVYSSLFRATLTDGSVVVRAAGPVSLPADTRHVVLQLSAGDAGAVIILQVTAAEEQPLPTVSFETSSYVLRVEIGQTGAVGRVHARASNGEAVSYSLLLDNDHLRSRMSVSNDGELRLSAPADSGTYTFQVIATTVFTQATGRAEIHLSVEALTVCGDDTAVTAPLIVIDRDEEEAHRNLVILNATEHQGCHYTLTNRWPADQKWLYVDESGLHTRPIDREDPSIAYMALSQVQVELNLICPSDTTRTKRSLDERLDWLGPYDYGNNKWVLTDTILHNPRRSIVNLIVNDINDNAPIFVGKNNEPLVVGYPVSDLEEAIMPRSLAELQATDADVGENAELRYTSEEPEIAVSPTTGFVHVRAGAQLRQDMTLTVNATDRNGMGLTGSISLLVKLLNSQNIAVITIREAFLEDESRILANLSSAIGYEVKSLRTTVISSEEQQTTRKKRDLTDALGTSLEVYVYGLLQREPVSVERLSDDINNAAIITVDIASILSLEDHLEGNEICAIAGRDTGLLAATITLSILLFILIIAGAVWFFLTRKKKQNYDEFSDANSIVSQNESSGQTSKPDVAKPRLNIEELKRSERRLQDMLNAPIEQVVVETMPTASTNKPTISPVAKPLPPDSLAPIVIQDKLKDAAEDSDEDEFGEVKKPRRKSVVTFNENVEKIIHVDDDPSPTPEPTMEVFKL